MLKGMRFSARLLNPPKAALHLPCESGIVRGIAETILKLGNMSSIAVNRPPDLLLAFSLSEKVLPQVVPRISPWAVARAEGIKDMYGLIHPTDLTLIRICLLPFLSFVTP